MRARTCGLAALALGILIGAGGCSSDSPTSPLAPSDASTAKGGGYIGGSNRQDTTSASITGGGYIGGSNRQESGATITAAAAGGGYIGGSN